jgi:two-component system, OmpR family, response regulator
MSKILIIEDNVEIATLLRDLLVKEEYDVMVCYDGVQGMEFTRKFQPNLIILDLMLPGGGGFFVLERLKLSKTSKAIPVIVLTASKDQTHREKAKGFGIVAYIEKPYENVQLLETISSALKR